MAALLESLLGNASSAHMVGARSRMLVEEARERVAALVDARPREVVFTGGATEANNLMLRGFDFDGRRLLISAGEHDSVRNVAAVLAQSVPVSTVPLLPSGEVDLDALDALLRAGNVGLVSVAAANSETGVLNPIDRIGELAHRFGALFHCDATQWVGRLPLSMLDFGVDALSCSAHKMNGPQGVGALVARSGVLHQLKPQNIGGGHENGLRSGSYNVVGIAGFGRAAELAADPAVCEQTRSLRDGLVRKLERIGGVAVNGATAERLPNTANLRFEGVPGDALLARCPYVAASLGSACHAGAIEPSPTLLAMGLTRDEADQSVRFSITRFTTEVEIDMAAALLIEAAADLRTLSEVA
jgi:cysteine desulfurase